MNLGVADILNRMRRQRFNPRAVARHPRMQSRIKQHVAFAIPANELAGRNRIVNGRPPMRVYGDCIPGRNSRIEHANTLVLQHERMVSGSGRPSIEGIRPRPCLSDTHGHNLMMPSRVIVKSILFSLSICIVVAGSPPQRTRQIRVAQLIDALRHQP